MLQHKCRLGQRRGDRPRGYSPASTAEAAVQAASTSTASPGRLPEGFPGRQNPGRSLLREREVAAVQSVQGLTRQSPYQHLGHLPADDRPGAKHLAHPPPKKKVKKKKEKHLAPTTPTRGRGGLEGALEGRGAKPTLPAPKPSREGRCSRQAAPQSKPRPGHAHRAPTGQAGRAGRSPAPPRPQRGPTEGQSPALIYGPPPMLYGFLNSAPATINVVNAEIISIFWCQAVIYSSHFSGGGSHAVKSSALPIKC